MSKFTTTTFGALPMGATFRLLPHGSTFRRVGADRMASLEAPSEGRWHSMADRKVYPTREDD